ncbi:MAG: hypothetical protein FJ398_09230 [Verrucomicrobia bacterium]|nr:hypothetical protein [Verrucomicrobiota bacterium]
MGFTVREEQEASHEPDGRASLSPASREQTSPYPVERLAGTDSPFLTVHREGNGSVKNSQKTFVGRGVTIRADATEAGDGGKVIVWADELTAFYGAISAKSAGREPVMSDQ